MRITLALKLLCVTALPVAASTLRQSFRSSSSTLRPAGYRIPRKHRNGTAGEAEHRFVRRFKGKNTQSWPRAAALARMVSTSRWGSVTGTTIPKRSRTGQKARRTNQ